MAGPNINALFCVGNPVQKTSEKKNHGHVIYLFEPLRLHASYDAKITKNLTPLVRFA